MSATWVDGLVRCPVQNISLPWNGNSNNSVMSTSDRGNRISGASDNGSSLASLLAWASQDSGEGQSSSHSEVASSVFPYFVTTVLYGAIALSALLYAVLIVWRYHGLRLLVATERGATVRHRRVTPATNNAFAASYFLSNCLGHAVTIAMLQISNPLGDPNATSGRVMALLQRCFLGWNCFSLAVALNQQRLHRVREHRHQRKLGASEVRRIQRTNVFCAVSFGVFAVADFLTSNAMGDVPLSVVQAFYWGYIAMLAVLSIPLVIAVALVLLSKARVQASAAAKGLMTVGVVIHLVVMLPPSLWNHYVFPRAVAENPCPLLAGRGSLFDLLVMANVVSLALLFWFVVVEHRRNRLLGQSEHYHNASDRVDTRLLNGVVSTGNGRGGDESIPETPHSQSTAARSNEMESLEGLKEEHLDFSYED